MKASYAKISHLISSIAQHVLGFIQLASHIIPLCQSAWCMSAGSALTVQCASIQCTQREFKWLLSLTCLLPKLALCTANYSHSPPEWSICISESKKRRGATGTVNQQMNTAYWLCGSCLWISDRCQVGAVVVDTAEKTNSSFRHSYYMQYG